MVRLYEAARTYFIANCWEYENCRAAAQPPGGDQAAGWAANCLDKKCPHNIFCPTGWKKVWFRKKLIIPGFEDLWNRTLLSRILCRYFWNNFLSHPAAHLCLISCFCPKSCSKGQLWLALSWPTLQLALKPRLGEDPQLNHSSRPCQQRILLCGQQLQP